MEVNVVDTVDYGLLPIYRQLMAMNQDPIRIPYGDEGVKRMVAEIIGKVKMPRSMNVLRIYAHGNSGVIAVTGGDVLEYPSSAISIWGLPKIKSDLSQLTPFFATNAQVELYGCYVATGEKGDTHVIKKDSDGEKLIIALAKLWNVRVLASGNTEKGLPIASFKFVGLVVEATPGGGLRCVPAPEINKL
jgi:hypothetical protein